MKKFLVSAMLICFASHIFCQIDYPFNTQDPQSSILAYWYNCNTDSVSVTIKNQTSVEYINPSLQIYGPMVADSFNLKAEAILSNNSVVYSKSFTVDQKNSDKNNLVISGNFFKLSFPVSPMAENPATIKITLSSTYGKIEKTINCEYHELTGKMTDFRGNPLKAFILVYPDGFGTDMACGTWSDSDGNYKISLPERTYNAFYVNDGNYKSTTMEVWSWHMIMDSDQSLDYKIGTGEVYNLVSAQ